MKIVVGLVVTVLGGWLLFVLTNRSSDLQYSLSQPLPVGFVVDQDTLTSVQQVELANLGAISAKNVQLLVKSHVEQYKITGASLGEPPRVTSTANAFEVSIHEFLPKQRVQVALRTGVALHDLSIVVTSSDGPGEQVLQGQKRWQRVADALVVPLFFFAIGLFGLFSASRTRVEFDARFAEVSEFLARKKSWLFSKSEWKKLRAAAIERIDARGRYGLKSPIRTSAAYRMLAEPAQFAIDESELLAYQPRIDRILRDEILSEASLAWTPEQLEALLEIERPVQSDSREWNEVHGKIHDRYSQLRLRFLHSEDTLAKELGAERPRGVGADPWQQHLAKVSVQLAAHIANRIVWSTDPAEQFVGRLPAPLPEKQRTELEKLARAMSLAKLTVEALRGDPEGFLQRPPPTWMPDPEYQALKRRAVDLVDGIRRQREYARLLQSIESLLKREPIEREAPSDVDTGRWQLLRRVAARFADSERAARRLVRTERRVLELLVLANQAGRQRTP